MKKNTELAAARKTLEDAMPRWAWPGVVLIKGKLPSESRFNSLAAERYDSDTAGKWKPEARMTKLSKHLLGGGNLGWVPPVGVVVLDCDNSEAVSYVSARQPKSSPRMVRKPNKQHFYVRCDPKTFEPLSKKYLIDTGGVDKADIDVKSWAYADERKAGGQAVIPPSLHEDGVPYAWMRKLPKDRAKIPLIHEEIQNTINRMSIKKDAPGTGASRHDKMLRYVQRLVIEAKHDDDATRHEVLGRASEFAQELFKGDAARTKAELEMLDRSYAGATQHASAFQGYSRDGSATHIAQRFSLDHGERWRYIVDGKQLVEWDGVYWVPIPDERILKMLNEYHRELVAEAAFIDDDKAQAILLKAAHMLKGKVFPEHVLAIAKRLYHVSLKDFDRDAHLLTFPASEELEAEAVTLDLRTGGLKDPDPNDLISKVMGAPYLIGAESPHFTKWRTGSLPDADLASWVQMAWGVTMFGDNRNQTFHLAQGLSNSGKSLMLGCAHKVFGDHAMKLDPEVIAEGRMSGGAAPERLRLRLHRFAHVGELASKYRLGSTFKDLTGGDIDASRGLYEAASEGIIKATLWCASNKTPTVDASDSGLRTRIKQIPMNAGAADGEPDQHLLLAMGGDALTHAAFCWWMIEGLNAARALGFVLPPNDEVDQATEEFWEDQDLFAEFIQSGRVVRVPDGFMSMGEVRSAYDQWMLDAHPGVMQQEKMGRNDFLSEVRRWLGVTGSQKDKTQRRRGFRGIAPGDSRSPTSGMGSVLLPKLP